MAWCHQARNHYLSQYWSWPMMPNVITRPQWVILPQWTCNISCAHFSPQHSQRTTHRSPTPHPTPSTDFKFSIRWDMCLYDIHSTFKISVTVISITNALEIPESWGKSSILLLPKSNSLTAIFPPNQDSYSSRLPFLCPPTLAVGHVPGCQPVFRPPPQLVRHLTL